MEPQTPYPRQGANQPTTSSDQLNSVADQIARSQGGFFIKQSIEAVEMITAFKTPNKYHVMIQNPYQNGLQKVMYVSEKTNICTLQCGRACGSKFVFKLGNVVVMEMERGCSCVLGCCNLCNSEFKVKRVNGSETEDLATFKSSSCVCKLHVKIESQSLEPLYAESDCAIFAFQMIQKKFKCIFADNQVIEIRKEIKGLGDVMREMFTDADRFKITLPDCVHEFLNSGRPLHTNKELLDLVLISIALTVAIDQYYFEDTSNEEGQVGLNNIIG